MADEYIDKVEVGAKIQMMYIRREMDYGGENDFCRGMRKALRIIENTPSADVQPVKHGRWIETHISLCKWIPEDEKEEGHSFYMAEMKCSCCERYNTQTFSLSLNKPDFCQLCGARMDLKDSDDDETL